MKPNSYLLLIFTLASLLVPEVLRAESVPPFEKFASNCVLIVKARQAGPFSTNENFVLTFEVTETWKGRFDPQTFTKTSPEGYIRAGQGEHGVRVTAGQEIIFFFTRHNQPEGKLARHNAAFPITDGKLVYGSTSESVESRVFTTAEFKRAIAALSAPAQSPEIKK